MASKFVWYELMTTDLEAAKTFYSSVVGWRAEDFPAASPYVVMNAGDRGVAGLMTIPEEAKTMGAGPSWLGYIYAPDTDAATRSVQGAGGKVYREPVDIPDVGRFSVVTDPQGATFMLMTPRGPEQAPAAPNTAGHVGWHELYAADWEKAFDFYSSQFGWTKDQAMDMGPMGTYQLFAADGEMLGGMMNKPPAVPMPMWIFYFNVDALDGAMERVKAGGGQVMHGPVEVPGGSWIAQCMDPQGAMFALVAPKR
ncbi:VOC family protein [Pseudaminobacter sp. 19-2017]|uniref:VOC family protein n=1 Tax=Pseudaminobacter soli (ex Zhang et al. 2022) TaxID=2831468 RepID=A0A942E428_9HYPH|nr:VOC family protein [Pseudaminobacter soli]MBS3650755.1 VOC family protein [Pseudaminobacter soli]